MDTIYNYFTSDSVLSVTGWVFWLLVMLFVLMILWLFFGGGDYEYIGLDPLKIGVDSTKYIDEHTYNLIERSNRNAKKITGDDINPTICNKTNIPNDLINNIYSEENQRKALGKYKCYKNNKLSKGEKLCKQIVEEIYGLPFYCVRPDFLKNPETGRNLELDLYNDELKLAIEYNGIGHYAWPNPFHRTKEDFINQLRRDKFKVDTCDRQGIYLISVPYNIPLTYNELKKYVISRLPGNYVPNINENYECYASYDISDISDTAYDLSELSDTSDSFNYSDDNSNITISFAS